MKRNGCVVRTSWVETARAQKLDTNTVQSRILCLSFIDKNVNGKKGGTLKQYSMAKR